MWVSSGRGGGAGRGGRGMSGGSEGPGCASGWGRCAGPHSGVRERGKESGGWDAATTARAAKVTPLSRRRGGRVNACWSRRGGHVGGGASAPLASGAGSARVARAEAQRARARSALRGFGERGARRSFLGWESQSCVRSRAGAARPGGEAKRPTAALGGRAGDAVTEGSSGDAPPRCQAQHPTSPVSRCPAHRIQDSQLCIPFAALFHVYVCSLPRGTATSTGPRGEEPGVCQNENFSTKCSRARLRSGPKSRAIRLCSF